MKIYLDNNATTAIDPAVLSAMQIDSGPFNPSSIHSFGREARNMLTRARRSIAEMMGVRPKEIIFTSSGTEALNLLVRSIPKGHILTSNVEHSAVVTAIEGRAEEIAVGKYGTVTPQQISSAIRPDTKAIVLIAANNETGVRLDIDGVVDAAGRVPIILDGVALLGKENFSIPPGVSMAFSAHKLHGPKGVGFAVSRFPIKPLITGGGQEYGLRGGTENLSGILGLEKAISLFRPEYSEQMRRLRDRLEGALLSIPGAVVNGEGPRVCNVSNISFEGVDGDALLMNLDMAGVAVSHGSACSSGALEPSRILLNMGYSKERANSSIRFSLSRYTTEAEVDRAVEIVKKHCKSMACI